MELVIPLRAEFVSIARLTLSGVANRAGFDFDTIEDIKVALSEVCNRLIGDAAGLDGRRPGGGEFGAEPPDCKIEFLLSKRDLTLNFRVGAPDGPELAAFESDMEDDSALGLSLISVLMDEFDLNPEAGCVVSMRKYLENE
ncbi:MAG: ATP-binding protein [Clostridiales bacterium]|nr:ATP-binding protein [Clostridiales bacterium]